MPPSKSLLKKGSDPLRSFTEFRLTWGSVALRGRGQTPFSAGSVSTLRPAKSADPELWAGHLPGMVFLSSCRWSTLPSGQHVSRTTWSSPRQ